MKNLLLLLIVGLTSVVSAKQSLFSIITPNNAHELRVIDTLGRGRITDVGWTFDGQTLVVAGATGLWLYAAENLLAEPQFLSSQHGWIRSMAIHPEKRWVATGHDDGAIVIWDLEVNQVQAVLWGHNHPVIDLTYSLDGWWLLSFGRDEHFGNGSNRTRDQIIRVWRNIYNNEHIVSRTIILNQQDNIGSDYVDYEHLAISADNKLIFIGGDSVSIDFTQNYSVLFDFDTGTVREVGEWNNVVFSPDNQHILVQGSLLTTERMDIRGFDSNLFFNDAAFTADGRIFAIVRQSTQVISLWNAATQTELATFGSNIEATKVAFRPENRQLATVQVDETVRVWDVATQTLVAELSDFTGEVHDIAFSTTSQWLAIARWYTGLTLWDIAAAQPTFELKQPYIYGVAISPDNQWLAYATGAMYNQNSVFLLDLGTKQSQLFYSDDEPSIYERSLTQWKHWDAPEGLAISPNGQWLAWSTNYPHVWNIEQNAPLWTPPVIEEHAIFEHVAFYPSGNHIAVYEAWYEGIHLFNIETGEAIATFDGRDVYRASEFSPDGTLLAASSMETGMGSQATVIVWDVETQTELFKYYDPLKRYNWGYPDVAFSPDGRMLAYSSDEGNITLLEVDTWETIAILDGQQGIPEEIGFSADGRILAAGYASGVVLLWGIV